MTGNKPTVAFFCATYLKPEMHHVYRQIRAVSEFEPCVIAQKVENLHAFPVEDLVVVPRSSLRFVGRAVERHFGGTPWQAGASEVGAILSALSERDAKVLHVFFGNVAVHLLPLFRAMRIPVVISFHGADVAGSIAGRAHLPARREVFEAAALVACRSEALAERVVLLGCPRGKIRITRTVAPDVEFVPRRVPADGTLRVVQASRLIPKKGVETSLRAFARAAEKFPRARFVIAGTGPLENELRRLAGELGVADRVEFAGFLDQGALQALFRSAHVFIHPSETVDGDVEGIPNSMLEAMACGLPVIATRHGGIPEAVEDGSGGMLCGEKDAEGVANAIRRLADDSELYARISRGGAEAVERKFSARAVTDSLNALYAEAMGG